MMSEAGRYARSPQGRRHLDTVRRQITSRRAGRASQAEPPRGAQR